jgi:hypothetical protein
MTRYALALGLRSRFGSPPSCVPVQAGGAGDVAEIPIYDNGGDCSAFVHTNCNHPTALGNCALYVGGPDGSCILYEG